MQDRQLFVHALFVSQVTHQQSERLVLFKTSLQGDMGTITNAKTLVT